MIHRLKILLPLILVISCDNVKSSKNEVDTSIFAHEGAQINNDNVIINNYWKLKLQSSWEVIPSLKKEQEDKKVLARSKSINAIILLTKEELDGSEKEFIFKYYEFLKKDNILVTKIIAPTINNQRFILFEGSKDDRLLFNWVALKNRFVYNFSCVGPIENSKNLIEDCNNIISTLEIK